LLQCLFSSQSEQSKIRNAALMFCVLEQLAVHHSLGPPRKNIDWNHPCFRQLNYTQGQLCSLCTRKNLLSLIDEKNLIWAFEDNKHCNKLMHRIQGKVISLPDSMDDALNQLQQDGDTDVKSPRWHNAKDHSVAFRAIENTTSRRSILQFEPIFASALNVERKNVILDAGYLKTPPNHTHQQAHTDFKEPLPQDVYLAFTPLTRAGMFLQFWPEAGQPGIVVCIPYKKLLIVPCCVVHGGGFLSCIVNLNLRLHFYIYLNGKRPDTQNTNAYLENWPNATALECGVLDSLWCR